MKLATGSIARSLCIVIHILRPDGRIFRGVWRSRVRGTLDDSLSTPVASAVMFDAII